MTGFELLEVLVKTDKEILRNDIYAGESQGDRVIGVYLSGNNIVMDTEMQEQMRAIGG